MSHFSVSVLSRRLWAATLWMLVAILAFTSAASAALLDWQVANGDFNDSGNWIDYTTNDATLVPTTLDEAIVRNGGTLNITLADGGAAAAVIRVGSGARTGDPAGPLTPPFPYGGGTLNWTGGDITGGVDGPRINVGERDDVNNIDYTGIVNHSGGKISLNVNPSFLVIGSTGKTSTPTSVYNLSGTGIIGLVAGAGNNNNGINVRNGTFNMTGGQIVPDNAAPFDQRAFTLASTDGLGVGSEVVSYANFSGGTVNVNSGMRLSPNAHTKSFVTISGTASLIFRNDIQVGTGGTNAYAQVDMSAGSLQVGDPTAVPSPINKRLIIGDNGTGVFNLSGGTVLLNNSLVVANNASAKGTINHTGGTLTVLGSIEMNRNNPAHDPAIENATIIIDGPTAVLTQQIGQTNIGQRGNSRFELRQGQANLRFVDLSNQASSRATLNVMGGKLTIQDGLNRTDASAATIPTINLSGGEVELTPAGTSFAWQADLDLVGTDFDPKPGARLTTTVGVAGAPGVGKPGDFSLNPGSVWHLDIISNDTNAGADLVNVVNGSAALNGGFLNINLVGGYTPQVGDTVRIARSALGLVSIGSVPRNDPHWVPIIVDTTAGAREIRLTYVPEPTTVVLVGLGLLLAAASRRSRFGDR